MRKAVSMTALFSFIYLTFSGVVMYITPPGRIAYWADWSIFGMDKTMYNQTHTTMSMLFIAVMVLHIWLNWKPLFSYMKNRAGKVVVFTRETVFGLLLSVVFIVGTLTLTPPFGTVVNSLDSVKEGYEESLGNPPYPHAELTTLSAFIKRMKFDENQAVEVLQNAKIRFTMEQNLKTVAEYNNTDPAHIYEILKPTRKEGAEDEPIQMYDGVQNGVDMSKYESMTGSGMGKKNVADVAESLGLTLEEAIERLNHYDIKAEGADTLKDVGASAGVMPMDIYIIIDSGVKPE